MTEMFIPPAAGGLIEKLRAALVRVQETDRRIEDQRVELAVKLAQQDVGLALRLIVEEKVACGTPSPEDLKIHMIAKMIRKSSRSVTKAELMAALQEFQDPASPEA